MSISRVLILLVVLLGVPPSAHAATVDLTKPTFGGTVEFWALPEDPYDESGTYLKSSCGPTCGFKTEKGGRRCPDLEHGHCVWLGLELRPISDDDARFVSWSGCPTVTGTSCFVGGPDTPIQPVTANFDDVAAPVVTITVPKCPCKGEVTLSATATDNDRVTSVQFFAGATPLGKDTTAPYEWKFDSAAHPTGTLTVKAQAADAARAPNTAEASAQIAIDNTPPEIIITAGPTLDPGTSNRNPSFEFTSGDATSRTCSIDGGPFTSCTSPISFANLADGEHTLRIRASDALDNTRTISHPFKVDTVGPLVTIPGAPTNPVVTRNRTPTFAFTAESAKKVECRVDSGPWVSCTSPYVIAVPLVDGAHILTVRAADALENVGEKSHAFTIDTIAPDTTITAGPAEGARTSNPNPEFRFAATEPDVIYTCALDGASQGCPSSKTYANLNESRHALAVYATDAAGNPDLTPAVRNWTIDVTKPVLEIVAGPTADPGTRERAPEFSFRSGDAVTVDCALDDKTASGPCTTAVSHHVGALTDGVHVLYIHGVDAAGNDDTLKHSFRIDTTPPETEITDGITGGAKTTERAARFEFKSNEPGVILSCRLDGAPLAACVSPLRLDGLALGEHRFEVVATDRVGNTDPTPASRTWTVVLDADGDGFPVGADCDDAKPAINPGARDVPGNALDEDCKDGPRPPDPVRANVRVSWSYLGPKLRVVQLVVVDAAKGTRIDVRCGGSACPLRAKRMTASRSGKVVLTKLLKGRWLRPGTRLTVDLTAPHMIGRRVELRVARNGHRFTRIERCLAAGTSRIVAC